MRAILPIRTLFLALFLLAVSSASFAQISIGISVGFPPPPIPVYEQPICPQEGYIWTPGYWAWDADGDDYFWVPGTWVAAPVVGYLWTPGYWGWGEGGYFFHEGYWGPHVGWYGGISYGFGYFGHGYEGGRWDHDRFYYNRSVTNVNVTNIHNVYNTTIINRNESRVSYNGGNGGTVGRPSREEENYSRERHVPPVSVQNSHAQEARSNRELRASVNQGRPPIAATQRPGSFRGSDVVPAREAGGRYERPANRGANNNAARPDNNPNRPPNAGNASRPSNAVNNANRPSFNHAREITPHDRPAPPQTSNPRQNQKYQQQQDKLYNKQQQEHQKLQQQQERDHQRLTQQNANDARRQQVEQRHQQQTQQMEQRHTQQQQRQQQKQQPQHQSDRGGKPGRP